MPQYDEDIKLSVDLDTAQVKGAVDNLNKQVEKIFSETSGKKLDAKFNSALKRIDDTAVRIRRVREQIEKMETTKVATPQYAALQNQYTKLSTELGKIREREASITANLQTRAQAVKDLAFANEKDYQTALKADAQYRKLSDSLFTVAQRHKEIVSERRSLNAQMLNLQKKGVKEAFESELDSEKYKKLTEELNKFSNAQTINIQRYRQIREAADEAAKKEEENNTAVSRLAVAYQGVRSAISGVAQGFSTAANFSKRFVSSILGSVKKVISGVKKLAGYIRKFFDSIRGESNSAQKTFRRFMRVLLRYGFNVRSLFFLVRRLRSAAAEGIQNLAHYSSEVNDVMSVFSTNILYLKNVLGTLIEPFTKTIGALFDSLADKIGLVVDKINQFTGAVFGKQIVYRATKLWKSYADAVSAADEAQKHALASYDKLDVIQRRAEKDSGYNADEDYANMFEIVDVGENAKNLVQRLRDMWNKADFTELGRTFGDKITEIIGTALEKIGSAKEFLRRVSDSIRTFITGALETIQPDDIGKAIADLISSAFGLAANFLLGISWSGIGEKIGSVLRHIFESLTASDWENILSTLLAPFWLLPQLISGALDKLSDSDWATIAESMRIGFTKTLSRIGAAFQTLFGSVFAGEVHWDDLGSTIGEKLGELDWGSYIELASEKISYALFNVSAFLRGVKDGLNEANENGELDWAVNILDSAGYILNMLGELLPLLIKIGTSIMTYVVTPVTDLVNRLLPYIEPILEKILPWLERINGVVGPLISSVAEILEPALDLIAQWLDNNAPTIELVLMLLTGVSTILNVISMVINRVLRPIIKLAMGDISGAIDDMKSFGKLFEKDIPNSVKKGVNNMSGSLETMINGMSGVLEKFTQGIARALNWIIRQLNKISFDVPSWIPGIGGNHYGIQIPEIDVSSVTLPRVSIPRLAMGAVLPPNQPFLAMLGDQKSGTNVETPLSTIKQAIREELASMGGNGQPIILQLDGKTVAQVVWDENEKRYKQYGSYVPVF